MLKSRTGATKMADRYDRISGIIQKNYLSAFGRILGIGYTDFSPTERDSIMSNLATKIKEFTSRRETTIKQETWIGNNGSRIKSSEIKIRSADEVVSGTIGYTPAYIQRPCELSFPPTISVKLKYCPTEEHPGDVEEYTGLVRLIQEAGFRV